MRVADAIRLLVLLVSALLPEIALAGDVYIASGRDGVMVAAFDDATGALSNLRKADESTGCNFLALHPGKPYLYTSTRLESPRGAGGVAAFRIVAGGKLEALNTVSTGGAGACHVSVDVTGSTVMAANYRSGSIASFQIHGDGSLSKAVSQIQHKGSSVNERRQQGPRAHYIQAGPDNRFAYVADLGIDQVLVYRLNAESSELAPSSSHKLAPGAGPRHLKFSSDGKLAYVLNELNLTVTTFRVDRRTGALEVLGTVSAVPDDVEKQDMSCAEVRLHPNGKYLYTSQRDLRTRAGDAIGRNSISVYRLKKDGLPQRIQTMPAGVRIPRNFNLNPSGRWLLVAGQTSNDIVTFAVDPATGKLGALKQRIECAAPMCIEFAGE